MMRSKGPERSEWVEWMRSRNGRASAMLTGVAFFATQQPPLSCSGLFRVPEVMRGHEVEFLLIYQSI